MELPAEVLKQLGEAAEHVANHEQSEIVITAFTADITGIGSVDMRWDEDGDTYLLGTWQFS